MRRSLELEGVINRGDQLEGDGCKRAVVRECGADQQTGDHRLLVHVEPATPLDQCLHPCLPSSEGDRDAAGKFETLPHVLPVPGGDKE